MCIYNEKHAFIALLSIDKELFLYLTTTRIQFRRHDCTNKALVFNSEVVCSAFRWLFSSGKLSSH